MFYSKELTIEKLKNSVWSKIFIDVSTSKALLEELKILQYKSTSFIIKGPKSKIELKKNDLSDESIAKDYDEKNQLITLHINNNDLDFIISCVNKFINERKFTVDHIDVEFYNDKFVFDLVIKFSEYNRPLSANELTDLILNDD